MSGDVIAPAIFSLILLVLVASSLFGRGLSMRNGVKYALGWLAIFAGAFVLFGLRDEIGDWAQVNLSERAVIEGSTTRVPRSDDGHFWIDAEVNGRTVRMLVDSGASTTTLDAASAQAAGVAPSGAFPVAVGTANGVVTMQRARAERLTLGSIKLEDVPVQINQHDDTSVLGMNTLSRLKRWGVEGRWLVLEP